jgi:peptidoglycan hydrolase CwlO-like protein
MRWLLGAVLLLCTGSLLAQSLGDVARQQRENTSGPKATHVYTNADLAPGSDGDSATPPEKPSPGAQHSKAAGTSETDRAMAAMQQRHLYELSQRVQLLESEIRDKESQVSALNHSAVYGDPNRVQQNEEIRRISGEIEETRTQLTSAREELAEEIERARRTSVVK